ncbi:alcohol dehydrogenase catalytic domain-containing protein [Nonomuraea phyllanthi]|uniref:Alcohol dehydrogenase catalytic domain-containing protein n=1 Tax=Nonomuraea phyllanthi TaxID=2219224 RepID=A0A5C4WWW6_9ACTN|nr:glucose 1-dehydrogenase [Nonomuraea phyllanthi]KAB8197325.1 alcohol dehydrogenase catalytic domain-containing protein [Nonomuraea phyllanthi]QFY06680.1 alcohol dehydrogenase catalytic domain-containing protein [Nonomuraea phyllanthi]
MRALTFAPGKTGTLAVEDVPDPVPGKGLLVVEGLALGVCGTDRELATAEYGWPPPGRERMVIGHESLGRVLEVPEGSAFSPGDLVVGVVRRPDPEPCGACARGEFDMCRNGRYTERGIKQLDGYASQHWTVEAGYAVRLDPSLESVGMLVEPASVVAKAWDHIERIGSRAWFEPRTLLVTGAGPVGLLAALMGRQRGLDVHVLNRSPAGLKSRLVEEIGATYHSASSLKDLPPVRPDIIIECTGAGPLVIEAMTGTAAAGIVCLAGLSPGGRTHRVDPGVINRDIVLENDVVFGTVNANLRHYRDAAVALAKADLGWLERLITRRVPLSRALEAFERGEDVKVVIDLTR